MTTAVVKKTYDSKARGTCKLIVEGQEGYLQVKGDQADFPIGATVTYELTGQAWGKTHETSSCVVEKFETTKPPAQEQQASTGGTVYPQAGQPTPKDLWIVRQHSQQHALTALHKLLDTGAITLPEKPAGRLKVYLEVYRKLVASMTQEVFAAPDAATEVKKAAVKKVAPAQETEQPEGEDFNDDINI